MPLNDIHRMKSLASARDARSHPTSTAHRNRNHLSRSIPYERTVTGDGSHACRSAKYSATAATTCPVGSTSSQGTARCPVARSDPT